MYIKKATYERLDEPPATGYLQLSVTHGDGDSTFSVAVEEGAHPRFFLEVVDLASQDGYSLIDFSQLADLRQEIEMVWPLVLQKMSDFPNGTPTLQ